MARLIAIEGIDGAGKRTLADALAAALPGPVARLAFPRYGADIHADLIREGLYGNLGPFGDEVYGMAMLYTLDRHNASLHLAASSASAEFVLLDRYIASNAAFGAARLRQDARGQFVRWVHDLEISQLALPAPDLHLLVRVSPSVAAARARHREDRDTTRSRDTWEADDQLQARAAAVYDELARAAWLAPWHVVEGDTDPDVDRLVALIAADAPVS